MNRPASPAVLACLSCLLILVGCSDAAVSTAESGTAAPSIDPRYRQAAIDAGEWIRSHAIDEPEGTSWPADPLDTGTVAHSLYTGVPGVVLYFLDAYRLTGEPAWLDDARAGADYLLGQLDRFEESMGPGLYTGLGGIAFVLTEVWRSTDDPRYRAGADRAIDRILATAVPAGRGIEWIDSTDIISGSAGTGLLLLYAAERLDRDDAVATAAAAGRRLIELGRPQGDGTLWMMSSDYERNMPNFSHGTAGVAYFLARLHEVTGEREFLDVAIDGARYLQSIADVQGEACLILHHEPEGEELFYLSWCHGPAGTARTFYKLWELTGDQEWRLWVDRLANGILAAGAPEERSEGFWNNVGQCCGSAGVGEFFLALYRETGDARYLEHVERAADDILDRATRTEDGGLMWIQAEHRVRPDFLVAQTGYMQGAAGIGMLLLHLDAVGRGEPPGVTLPDSPY